MGEGRVCPDGSIAPPKTWRGTGALSRHHRLYILCGSELRPQTESRANRLQPGPVLKGEASPHAVRT